MFSRFKLLAVLFSTSVLATCASHPVLIPSLLAKGKTIEEVVEQKGMPYDVLTCRKDGREYSVYLFLTVTDHGDRLVLVQPATHPGGTNYWQWQEHKSRRLFAYFTDDFGKVTSVQRIGSLILNLGSDTPLQQFIRTNRCSEFAEARKAVTTEELMKQKPRPRLWRAITYNSKNSTVTPENTYISEAYTSEEKAKAESLRKCRKGEGNGADCQNGTVFSNMCFAQSAGTKNGRELYYPGMSLSPGVYLSEYTAFQSCKRFASNCAIKTREVCALACDISKDNKCFYEPPILEVQALENGKVTTKRATVSPLKLLQSVGGIQQ